MGGGGFTMEPDNPALDEYVLSLAPAPLPRVCLLPTAGGDARDQIQRFQATFEDLACEPSHVSLFRLADERVPLAERLLEQDVIYVGGGSMINLLAIWRAQGVDRILREAWRRGIVLAGLSAGSMCWFEWGVTTGAGHPTPARGLGFLPGSNSVHHDGEPKRRPVYLDAVGDGRLPPGYAADDGVGLLFDGLQLVDVVTSRPHARAYRVTLAGEQTLQPRLLSARRRRELAAPSAAVSELRRTLAAQRTLGRRSLGRP